MKWLGPLATWAIWWVVLVSLWLLYQGEWNALQLYAAMSAAAVGATIALLVRRYALPSVRLERRWLARIPSVPVRVVREFVLVTAVLVRALVERRVPNGEFRAIPFPAGGARPGERGRRALVAALVSYSPNSYVIDVDEAHNLVLVHVLARVPRGDELL